MKGKKASHVGVVISFVIFITFIIFLYSVTEPITRVERGKQDLLEFLKIELINQFTTELTTETILIKNADSPNCIKIDIGAESNMNSVVKNEETGQILESYLEGSDIKIQRNGATQIKTYYSEGFSENQEISGCDNVLAEEDFQFGLVRTLDYVFENLVVNFSEFISNQEGYETIKQELNMPSADNFGFAFEDGNRNIIVQTEERDVPTDIYVEEVPIQYVDSEANIKSGFLRIKVW